MGSYDMGPDFSEWDEDNTGDYYEFYGFEMADFEGEFSMEPLLEIDQKSRKKSIKKQQRAQKSAILNLAKKKYRELFPADRRFDRHILSEIERSLGESTDVGSIYGSQEEEPNEEKKFAVIKVQGQVIKGLTTNI